MNHLSFSTEQEWFGLCFVLLVDGVPFCEKLGDGENVRSEAGIPYWLLKDGFSRDPTDGKVLVTVCGCGAEGCGHTRCRVTRNADVAVFDEFTGERNHARQRMRFAFPLCEVDAAELAMTKLAREQYRK